MRKIACLILMLWGFSAMKAQVPIPDQMTYCGVELRFSPGAKRILSDHVRKFYESPRYFNEMVKRANIYMPFIEEALRNVGAPEDLKYLSIQESALRPDVVSKSNAVGFWQFKEATGVEMGLRINDRVDERRHIYRATEAAGKYLLKANRDFDNWIYAVLAYYEGLTGAVPYTDPQYYSNRKMFVREDMHWYVLKAIAHKIAYEAPISQRRRPDINLLPYSNLGEENLRALLDRHPEVEWSAFFEYNKWILNSKKLPRNELFTYYLPQKGEFYSGHKEDPNKVSGGGIAVYDPATTPQFSETIGVDEPTETRPISSSVPRPTSGRPSKILEDDVPVEKAPVYSAEENTVSVAEVSDEPPVRPPSRPTSTNILDQWTARPFSELGEFEYVEFILEQDLHYGVQYVFYNGSKRIVEIANEYQKRLSDLLTWNGLIPGEEPQTGSVVYLAKPSRLDYHIVRPRETLQNIAALHLSSVKKLRKYNRLPKNDQTIYIGQKLYLTSKKPKGEKILILTPESQASPATASTKPIRVKPENPKAGTVPSPRPQISETRPIIVPQPTAGGGSSLPDADQPRKRWVVHTVRGGDTLWGIAQLYGTKVAIIKQINKLGTDNISEGMQLRILAEIK